MYDCNANYPEYPERPRFIYIGVEGLTASYFLARIHRMLCDLILSIFTDAATGVLRLEHLQVHVFQAYVLRLAPLQQLELLESICFYLSNRTTSFPCASVTQVLGGNHSLEPRHIAT
jgi:hypothetical protein